MQRSNHGDTDTFTPGSSESEHTVKGRRLGHTLLPLGPLPLEPHKSLNVNLGEHQ